MYEAFPERRGPQSFFTGIAEIFIKALFLQMRPKSWQRTIDVAPHKAVNKVKMAYQVFCPAFACNRLNIMTISSVHTVLSILQLMLESFFYDVSVKAYTFLKLPAKLWP